MKKTFEIEFGWAEYRINDVPIGLTVRVLGTAYSIERNDNVIFSNVSKVPKLFL